MLPVEIKALINTRNNSRKIFQRTNSEEIRKIKNNLSNVITKKLVHFNNNNWNKKLNSLNIKDNSLWKAAKCSTKETVTSIPALQGQDGLVYNDLGKSNLLAAHYEKVYSMTNCMKDDVIDRLADAKYQNLLNREITAENIDLVTPREIQKSATRTKSKKAPGLDVIQNIVLKNLSKIAFVQLTYIFNASLRLSHFPTDWKTANILPFYKSNKDKNQLTSYRPISLLPTLSKILEKIIYIRILNFESKNIILIPEKFGFRGKRSTLQQLFRVTNHISTNLNKNKSTALVLLDLEKAFDTVWTKGLIYKPDSYNVPLYILKFYKAISVTENS